MVKARKYLVRNRFIGLPTREDFELVEEELPPLEEGEILIKAEWISFDTYIHFSNITLPLPYYQDGFQIGIIEESKSKHYSVGTRIMSYKGWADYSIINADICTTDYADMICPLPDLQDLPISYGIGAVGMTGAAAYFGFLEICKPKSGETVVVSGASGAVGSIVGQIAKIKGCRVIGFAGTDEKVKWLEDELGFDKVINYKTDDIPKELTEAAPNGIDCYFDNIGGQLSSMVINQMNMFGRISVCGAASFFDNTGPPPSAVTVQPAVVFKQLSMEGFAVWRWSPFWPQAFDDLVQWIRLGKIKVKERIREGFTNLYDSFLDMSTSNEYGKYVLKV